ncbi:MAG: hypothetical protein WAM58_10275 [Candidatus Acidiferrum sp.]
MGHEITSKLLVALKEKPSFEGELCAHLREDYDADGRAKYFLVCQKTPPFNVEEFALIAGVRGGLVVDNCEEITKGISWRQEVSPTEVREILDILEHQVISVVPETVMGLDGTTYELLIERGFSKVQFTWWCEPPAVWKVLGEVSKRLLSVADATSTLETLQPDSRKQVIKQLREELDKLRARREEENEELMKVHNLRCYELSRSLRAVGLTCPGCGRHSKENRFVDKSPDAKSYFICSACGRSIRPEDL